MESAKLVRTTCGTVDRDSVAFVLPHERIFHEIGRLMTSKDIAKHSTQSDGSKVLTDGICMDQLTQLRRDPLGRNGLNMILQSEDEAFRECQALLRQFQMEKERVSQQRGLMLSVTTPREGRDDSCDRLKRLSERVPVDFVVITSFDFETNAQVLKAAADQAAEHQQQEEDEEQQTERIAKFLETELLFGLHNGSNFSAGAIYQQIYTYLSTSQSRVLAKGCAKAQIRTGAPLFLSFSVKSAATVRAFLHQLLADGAQMDRIVLCHCDLWSESEQDMAFLEDIASSLGVNLLFDLIGLQWASETTIVNPLFSVASLEESENEPPRDSSIAHCISSLLQSSDGALAGQILLSSGVWLKTQYKRYGGCGFGHLFDGFHRRLTREGVITEATWRRLTRDNAMELLCWFTAPPLAEAPKHYLMCSVCSQFFEPIEGEYFSKFQFVYCGTKCLRRHRLQKFAPL